MCSCGHVLRTFNKTSFDTTATVEKGVFTFMNSYELSRSFFNWSFNNPDKIKPIHTAIYFFAIEHCNRLGWKEKFGFPSQMVMEALGIKNWRTYSKGLNDLVDFGFIKMIEISKNQYSSNIIAIVQNTKAQDKALDKALQKHSTKQGQSIDSIDKQYNNEQYNNETSTKVDWDKLLETFNSLTNKKTRVVSKKVRSQINARLKEGYTKQDIVNAIKNCYNDDYHKETSHKYLTLEFITRSDKLEKYSQMGVTSLVATKGRFAGYKVGDRFEGRTVDYINDKGEAVFINDKDILNA